MVQLQSELIDQNYKPFSEYLKAIPPKYIDRWMEHVKIIEQTTLSEDKISFLKYPTVPIKIIVFSSQWCPECAQAVTILDQFTKINSKIELLIIDRDQSPELYEPFMPNGDKRVPVVLFTSEDYYLVTTWNEKSSLKFQLMFTTLFTNRGKDKELIFSELTNIFNKNSVALLDAIIDELFSELVRTFGMLNYSTRSQTTLS
jgi:glutaredoxin